MPDTSKMALAEHLRQLRQAISTVNRIVKSPRREPADTRRLQDAETHAEAALRALEAAILS